MDEQILHGLYTRCLHPLHLGHTAHDTLQEFIDIDVTSGDLLRILSQNPAYRQCLERYVTLKAPSALKEKNVPAPDKAAEDSAKKTTEKEVPKNLAPTYRLISLLGLLGTRNFILALRIFKATTGKFPEEVKGKWNFAPSDYLKKSLEMEEFCQLNKIEYGETAFAAAYMWDWLSAMARNHSQSRQLIPFIDSCWKTGQRSGLVAHAIADRYPNFAFHKYAMAAGITHNIGRALLAFLYFDTNPTYFDFTTKMDKIPNLGRLPYALQEDTVFQLSTPEISALGVRFFRIFKPLDLAIRYQLEPYQLKEQDKNLYFLASALYLATHMGHSWRLPTDDKDPLYKVWKRPWVKDLRLNEKKLTEIMKWAMTLKS